jgi:hypothetical protein
MAAGENLRLEIGKFPCCKTGEMKRIMLFDANARPMHLIKKTSPSKWRNDLNYAVDPTEQPGS